MGLKIFGLLNYEYYILNTVLKSTFARDGFVIAIIYIITTILRLHLAIVLCFIFTFNSLFDLIFPIIINVLLSMVSKTLFKYVEIHRSQFEILVNYLLKHYSRENLIRWKRVIFIGISCYILIAIAIVQIDNYSILVSTIQTIISFIICDFLENHVPLIWYTKLINWWNRPRIIPFINYYVIEDYPMVQQKNNIIKSHSKNATIGKRKLKNLHRSLDSISNTNNSKQIKKKIYTTIHGVPRPININNESVTQIPPKSPTPPLMEN